MSTYYGKRMSSKIVTIVLLDLDQRAYKVTVLIFQLCRKYYLLSGTKRMAIATILTPNSASHL